MAQKNIQRFTLGDHLWAFLTPSGQWFWAEKLCIGRSAISILDQQLFLVPLIGGRYHIIPQLAVYITYIPLIYLKPVSNQAHPANECKTVKHWVTGLIWRSGVLIGHFHPNIWTRKAPESPISCPVNQLSHSNRNLTPLNLFKSEARFPWNPRYLEKQLLLISINFTPKTSHRCLKN